jgi:lipopolysaccharide transport system permease protein
MKKNLIKLWIHRDLISELFKTFLKLRHVGSFLGVLWTLLNPAIYIGIYYLVFTYFIKMGIPDYHLFLIPGFLAWNFSFNSIISASESIIQSKYLISKIAFPNEILTITNVALSLFDFILSLIIYLVILFIFSSGFHFTALIMLLPVIVLLQFIFTIGIGFIVSCMSVYFRDIPKIIQLSGTVLFFITPIFYPLSNVPVNMQWILKMNPMTYIITFYHDVLYYHRMPESQIFAVSSLSAILIFLLGYGVFNHYKNSFAELS